MIVTKHGRRNRNFCTDEDKAAVVEVINEEFSAVTSFFFFFFSFFLFSPHFFFDFRKTRNVGIFDLILPCFFCVIFFHDSTAFDINNIIIINNGSKSSSRIDIRSDKKLDVFFLLLMYVFYMCLWSI